AMPKGGTLSISTSMADVPQSYVQQRPEARAGIHVCLTVKDTGCGMTQETLRRVFEPFFTTKEVGKGTGLGLATVYGIVEQHHGWIKVSSEVGAGSVFQCFLPALAAPQTEAPGSEQPHTPRGGTETILLVEDDPSV